MAKSTAHTAPVSTTPSIDDPETSPTPVKTYNLTRAKYWSYKNITLTDPTTSLPIYHATTTRSLSLTPQINLHAPSSPSQILAAVRLTHTKTLHYKLGPEIDCTPKDSWDKAVSESTLGRSLRFEVDGKTYRWKRTHKRDWGVRWWSDRCFKLVDGEGKMVMGYVTGNVLAGLEVGRVLVFEEMEKRAEVVALVVVLGVVERVRRE